MQLRSVPSADLADAGFAQRIPEQVHRRHKTTQSLAAHIPLLCEGINILEESNASTPLLPEEGGCAIKKTSRSILSRADGVVINHEINLLDLDHHPVRSIKVASQHFSDVAATPPRGGGECSHSLR